jgi:hypothetical protein
MHVHRLERREEVALSFAAAGGHHGDPSVVGPADVSLPNRARIPPDPRGSLVSGGPISQWRAGSQPAAPKKIAFGVGDVVVLVEPVMGFAEWRVISMPAAPGPSDVATLETVDPACPMKKIRRRVGSLIPKKEGTP